MKLKSLAIMALINNLQAVEINTLITANQTQDVKKFFGEDIMSQLTSSSSEMDKLIAEKMGTQDKQESEKKDSAPATNGKHHRNQQNKKPKKVDEPAEAESTAL